ncbi:MAG: hypothetical protein FHP94_03220 [Denitromonas halophila]|nr:MAG: hypothetical protein FHP94_03220 [Denitromonas halophila]TVT72867.1 MAG: hypothetical protein FHP93_07720 [Denitromonas halophila]
MTEETVCTADSPYVEQPQLDKSLAKGVFNQLWRDTEAFETELSRAYERIQAPSYKSRKSASKAIRGLAALHDKSPIVLARGMRADHRHPYFWSCVLAREEEAAVAHWKERAITFDICGVLLGQNGPEAAQIPSGIRIGEHAVRRVIQRIPRHGKVVPDEQAVVSELRDAALRGWIHHMYFYSKKSGMHFSEFEHIRSAMVPTQTGLFLGKLSEDRMHIDLRTYVHKSMLNTPQLIFWISEKIALNEMTSFLALNERFLNETGHAHELPDGERCLESVAEHYKEFDEYDPDEPYRPSILVESFDEMLAEVRAELAQQESERPKKICANKPRLRTKSPIEFG